MFTYKLQERILKLKSDKKIVFPSDFEIVLEFSPEESFGKNSKGELSFYLKDHSNKFSYNANNGHYYFTSIPPLQPIQLTFIWDNNYNVHISGNIIKISGKSNEWQDISHLLNIFHYFLPPLLNVNFPTTPYISRTSGKIGEAEFGWELRQETLLWLKESETDLKDDIEKSFSDFFVFANNKNDRLGAALSYYYNACRLIYVGNTPNEFLSEVVLNLSKSILVLFPQGKNNRDIIRKNLQKLDYSEEEIELKFIPIILLRNHYDVGHEFLTVFEQEELNLLYEYLRYCKEDFRELFIRIIKKLLSNSFELDEVDNFDLKSEKKGEWEKLKKSFKKRINISLKNHIKEIEIKTVLIK